MNGRAWWRRILKALHEIAAIGLAGGLATCLVIGMTANVASHAEFVAARLAIAAVARYVLMPSLALVLVTGMLAMLATRAFKDAGWRGSRRFSDSAFSRQPSLRSVPAPHKLRSPRSAPIPDS